MPTLGNCSVMPIIRHCIKPVVINQWWKMVIQHNHWQQEQCGARNPRPAKVMLAKNSSSLFWFSAFTLLTSSFDVVPLVDALWRPSRRPCPPSVTRYLGSQGKASVCTPTGWPLIWVSSCLLFSMYGVPSLSVMSGWFVAFDCLFSAQHGTIEAYFG